MTPEKRPYEAAIERLRISYRGADSNGVSALRERLQKKTGWGEARETEGTIWRLKVKGSFRVERAVV